jgi:hypothetical protein
VVYYKWECRYCGKTDPSNKNKFFYYARPSVCKECEDQIQRAYKIKKKVREIWKYE